MTSQHGAEDTANAAAPAGPGTSTDALPSRITGRPPFFDRFASRVGNWASSGGFFTLCLAIVFAWVPTIWVLPSLDTWQLVINTATTIVTFLLVALLQNTQSRSDKSTQHKLNAIAAALGDLMGAFADEHEQLGRHATELAAAVGLEHRVASVS